MRVPVVRGVIDRRILVNFQVDDHVLERFLPEPFRPKLAHGVGMAGVCLIRLVDVRPPFVPRLFGLRSENAAHRIAVEWEQDGVRREGVFIPRRDTSSRMNVLVGGRLFPGEYHPAVFDVHEEGDRYSVSLKSLDGMTAVAVSGSVRPDMPASSVFRSVEEASRFFEAGSLGYSVTSRPDRFDGLELRSLEWHVEPLEVEHVRSSFFEDLARFPAGSVRFDSALLMRGIRHEWHARETLCHEAPRAAVPAF